MLAVIAERPAMGVKLAGVSQAGAPFRAAAHRGHAVYQVVSTG
jgi:hypothetical protein